MAKPSRLYFAIFYGGKDSDDTAFKAAAMTYRDKVMSRSTFSSSNSIFYWAKVYTEEQFKWAWAKIARKGMIIQEGAIFSHSSKQSTNFDGLEFKSPRINQNISNPLSGKGYDSEGFLEHAVQVTNHAKYDDKVEYKQLTDKPIFVYHVTDSGNDYPGQGNWPYNTIKNHGSPPHLWYDCSSRVLHQTVGLAYMSYALAHPSNVSEYRGGVKCETNDMGPMIQCEFIGKAATSDDWPDDWLRNIAEDVIAPVNAFLEEKYGYGIIGPKCTHQECHDTASWAAYFGAANVPPYPASTHVENRFTAAEWVDFQGTLGHQHVPGNDHWCPGKLDIGLIASYAHVQSVPNWMAGKDDGTLTQKDIGKLWKLKWDKNAKLYLHGCNTGNKGERGWCPAEEFSKTQKVTAYGEPGYSYFSTSPDSYSTINEDELGGSDDPVYLHAYDRGQNNYGNFWSSQIDRIPRTVYSFKDNKLDLKGSVGRAGLSKSGNNYANDVQKIKERLNELGYTVSLSSPTTADAELTQAIRVFQAAINGSTSIIPLTHDGRVDPGFSTRKWLEAENAPRWVEVEDESDVDDVWYNFEKLDDDKNSYWCTDWLRDTVDAASKIYKTKHSTGQPIWLNDASKEIGGYHPDHSGHESGLCYDIRTTTNKPHDTASHFIYSNGNDPVATHGKKHAKWSGWPLHPDYDQEAARTFLKALKSQKEYVISKRYFNDSKLIEEGLCKAMGGHHHHFHVSIKAPKRIEGKISTTVTTEVI